MWFWPREKSGNTWSKRFSVFLKHTFTFSLRCSAVYRLFFSHCNHILIQSILIRFQDILASCVTDLGLFCGIALFDWLVFLSIEPDWRLGRFGQWGDLIREWSPAHPVSLLVNGVMCLSWILIGHDEALARSDWRRRGDVRGTFKRINSWPLTFDLVTRFRLHPSSQIKSMGKYIFWVCIKKK